MNNTKVKIRTYDGIVFSFLAAIIIAVAALNTGLLTEPGKFLPSGLSMRNEPMNEGILQGIDLAIEDIEFIRSGNASSELWRLLTFVHLDFFFYLALLIPQAAKTILMTGYYVRFGLCCSAMYYFLSKHLKLTRFPSLLLAFMYAFSTQLIFTAQLHEVMNMAFLMPVLMSSFDSYLRKRTWKSFVLVCLASFALGATGGFGLLIGIPAMIFIGLFMCISLYRTFNQAFTSWLKILGGIITGAAMTAAFSIPGFMGMKPDIDIKESFTSAKVTFTAYDFFRSTYPLRSGNMYLNKEPLLYVGVLTVMAVLAFILNENIPVRIKVSSSAIAIVFYATCCSSFVNEVISIFGANPIMNSARIICLEVLVFMLAGIGLKNVKGLSKGELIAVALIPMAFLIVANNNSSGTTLASPILTATFIAILIEAGIICALARDKFTKISKYIVLFIMLVLVGINTAFIMFNNSVSRMTVEEYFLGDEESLSEGLVYDAEFDIPAVNGGGNYLIIPEDLSTYNSEGAAIYDINFISQNVSGTDLFDEVFLTLEDEDEIKQKSPDRFGLDAGYNVLAFNPFNVDADERIFVYCNAMNGAALNIITADGEGERVFTGPFLTELEFVSGNISLEFTIDSEGEEVCNICLYKLNKEALDDMKALSGEANLSKFKINVEKVDGTCTLILPYPYDESKVRVNGISCNTFELCGKMAAVFTCDGSSELTVAVERKASGVLPGILISSFVALCLIAIPICQMYNEKKKVSCEGNATDVK